MASNSTIVTALILCGFLGHTSSQGDPDMNKNVYEILNDWGMHNRKVADASNPDVTAIPTFPKMNNVLKQKCDKNGGAGAFENADRAKDELKECIQGSVVMSQLSDEMVGSEPTGDLSFVIKTYCRNAPVLRKCLNNYVAAIKPCVDPQEMGYFKELENIVDALLSFVCFKDGDRIVQFVSAHGPECLQWKQQGIMQCVIPTLGYHLLAINRNNGSSAALDSPPPVAFGAKDCADATTIQSCVVKELEECPDPTPANIVDSLFNHILQATPCKEFLTDRSDASTSTINLVAASIAFLVLRLI